jgi:hypothetical protein
LQILQSSVTALTGDELDRVEAMRHRVEARIEETIVGLKGKKEGMEKEIQDIKELKKTLDGGDVGFYNLYSNDLYHLSTTECSHV